MITAYYKFQNLPDAVKRANNFKSKQRLDCIEFVSKDDYKGLDAFVSKDKFFLYLTACKQFVSSNTKRIAEYSLTGKGLNLSSIYIDDLDNIEFGYGYPNPNRFIGKDKKPNPLFPFRNDAYLFKVNADYSEIELFVIQDGRHLINSYYQILIDGGFDEEIELLRKQARQYFNYKIAI